MDWKQVFNKALLFLKWLLLAVLTGLILGPLGALFGLTLEWVNALRESCPWIIWCLPVGGLFIVALYRAAGQPEGGSTNAVFIAVRENRPMPLRTAPLIFVSTAITHLLGGSAGREGAALQLGGSISGALGQLFRLDDKEIRIITSCGMAAAFSAIFGTPLAATVFTMEVISVGRMYYAAFTPAFISALTALWIAGHMGLQPTSFALSASVPLSPLSMVQVCGMGALFAVLSAAFCLLLHHSSALAKQYLKNPYIRVVVGSFLIIVLTLLLRTTDYNGAGGAVIRRAIEGEALPWAFALKMLFTALTLAVGFKGGEIVPVFFTGATFGCVAAPLLGLPAPFGAALGMVSLFCGVTNCPISSILLAIELFGGKSIPLFALSCIVAYTLSGYFGLYSEQIILYSKLRPEFIDRKAS